ncbi:MAG TPA: D-alanyl-D-alanine carboxypeptidase family protein [Pyrinomonadaceae bacterium]
MKNVRIHIAVMVGALAVVAVIMLSPARSSSGQAPRPNVAASFVAAAERNATLKNELTWTFGGKQQRGWYLYESLIGKTLNTHHDSTTSDFAAALAGWQKKMRLSADGVLDENSLMRMVSQWQSNRLKNRTYATPDQLLEGAPSDFYDPGRAAELRQVERNTYAAYKEMVAAARADRELNLSPKYLKIVSAFRSREYQDELRQKSPNSGPAGLAVNSPHFTGRALDLYVGGDPVDTKDSNRAIQVNTPAYRWLVLNAERFGFRPYFYEPWHWEYVK